jgi:hypothetical protein
MFPHFAKQIVYVGADLPSLLLGICNESVSFSTGGPILSFREELIEEVPDAMADVVQLVRQATANPATFLGSGKKSKSKASRASKDDSPEPGAGASPHSVVTHGSGRFVWYPKITISTTTQFPVKAAGMEAVRGRKGSAGERPAQKQQGYFFFLCRFLRRRFLRLCVAIL